MKGSTPISADDRLRIDRFIELFLASPFRRPVAAVLGDEEHERWYRSFPGHDPWLSFWVAPREMLSGPPDAAGNAPWHPIPSPIDEEMVEGFERLLQAPLPPLFKAYLTRKSLLGMDLYEGTLPSIDPRRPFEWVEWSFLVARHTLRDESRRIVPFTDAPAETGILCFDTSQTGPGGDSPVLFVRVDQNDAGSPIISRIAHVFDSFAAYLHFLQDWLSEIAERITQVSWPLDHDLHFQGHC